MDSVEKTLVALIDRRAPLPDGADLETYDFIERGHVDSISLVRFVMEVEEHFGIDLTDDDVESPAFRRVRPLARLIQARQGTKGS